MVFGFSEGEHAIFKDKLVETPRIDGIDLYVITTPLISSSVKAV